MKTSLVIFLCVVSSAFGVSDVGLLPEDRIFLEVTGTERNPFGLNLPKEEIAKPKVENEEARIRATLDSFTVGGVSRSEAGVKVLFGPLVLEKGREVAPVIPNQTEELQVVSISEKSLELGFVESNGVVALRKVSITLDLAPGVQFKLGKKADGGKGRGFDGVISKDEPATQQ